MHFVYLLSLLPRSSAVSVVFDLSASLNDFAPLSLMLFSVDLKRKRKKRIVDGCFWSVFFLLSSPLRSTSVSVVFDFSDSLNDVAPVSPILLSVDFK